MNTFKIVFIGLNNDTLLLLNKSKQMEVLGVNFYDYFDSFSINPFDQLFKIAYRLHFKGRYRFLTLLILKIWNKFNFLSLPLFKGNKEYLNIIIKQNIEIIDTENTTYLASFLSENEIDLMVINSWGILPNELLNLPKYKTLNIHPSELPQYRGALPTLWTLKNGDNSSALTYLILNDFIDDGIIINQHCFEIALNEDWYSLEKKIASIIDKTLVSDILNYLNNKYQPIKAKTKTSFTGYYNKYREIDLSMETATEIYNKIGLYPFIEPFCYCYINLLNRRFDIKKANYYKGPIINRKDVSSKVLKKKLKILLYTTNGIIQLRLFKDINITDSLFLFFRLE